MPGLAHVQAATLERFLNAWKKWDAAEWLSTFSDDFEQVALPFSMGVPTRGRGDVEYVLPKLMEAVTNYSLDVHEIVHDPARNRAAVYIVSNGDLPWGEQLWHMEYAAFVTFNNTGEKVAKVEEMLDSAFMERFGPRFSDYLKEQGKLSDSNY